MVIGTYISIITLNAHRLNVPTKDTDWLIDMKNKTLIYAVILGHELKTKTNVF